MKYIKIICWIAVFLGVVQIIAIIIHPCSPLALRVIERNGLHILQSYDQFGFYWKWNDEHKFRSREGAEEYMQGWLEIYKNMIQKKEEILP